MSDQTSLRQPKRHLLQRWLVRLCIVSAAVGGMLLATALLAQYFLTNPIFKEKIQRTISEKIGLSVDYQQIGLRYLPTPSIELQQLVVPLPDMGHVTVAALRISPDFHGLLTGKLHLGLVELKKPEISLELAAFKADERGKDSTPSEKKQKTFQITVPKLSGLLMAGIQLRVTDGEFSFTSGAQAVHGVNLDMDLTISAEDVHRGQAGLVANLSGLTIEGGEGAEVVKGITLKATTQLVGTEVRVELEQLALAEPAFTLNGSLLNTASHIVLDLTGNNIDVDATRKSALALAVAGELSPIKEIFTYLTGGIVPQIHFHAQSDRFVELADYPNFRIEGHLQNGSVAIPEIELELTEVNGDVVIADGILSGTNLSTRLAGSAGRSGTLEIALKEDSDLFRLELMLTSNLLEAKEILRRVVDIPEFNKELDRITDLQGAATGKLILGDSLNDINAKVEDSDFNVTFSYSPVPFPIVVHSGQVRFAEKSIQFTDLTGTLAGSVISGLDCALNWEKSLHLDASIKQSTLKLAELFPWLSSLSFTKPYLQEVGTITGNLEVSSARVAGQLDQPKQWQYAGAGSLNGLTVTTPRFPEEIKLATGSFTLDGDSFSLSDTAVVSRDLNVKVSGTATDWKKLQLSLDGTLGKTFVRWLEEKIEIPKEYAIRAPLTLNRVKLTWQPKGATTFSGKVRVADGVNVDLDLQLQAKSLNVNRLQIKDPYSDVEMSLKTGEFGLGLGFKGSMSHETVSQLFVEPRSEKGYLSGDVSVIIPKSKDGAATAQGQLDGSQIVIPLASGDDIEIDTFHLQADGSQVNGEISSLSWHGFTWTPIEADVDFRGERIHATISKAELCGIDSPGEVTVVGSDVTLDINLKGKGLDVGSSYTCLRQGKVKMTGTLDVSSRVTAKGEADQLLRSLDGPFEMRFRDGTIEQGRFLATILEVLNVTEIVKGRLPDLSGSGFVYTSIDLQGQFRKGELFIDTFYMDGETLNIVGNGKIDLIAGTLEMELLAAPFKTVDSIIKYIPGINYLLGGSLVAIPLSVSGDVDDPKVTVMSVSSVSSSLLNLGERTIKLPLKLIQAIIPGSSSAE